MNYLKITLRGLWETLAQLFDKDALIWKGLFAVIMFFSGIHMYMLAVGALVMIDVVTGVAAALKSGEPFSSRKLRKGLLEKVALYMVLMIAVFLTDHLLNSVIHFKVYYLTFFVSFLMAVYEVTSIIENIYSIRPDLPFLGGLVRVFKKMGDKAIDKMEEKVDDLADQVTDVKSKIKDEEKPAEDGKP